jgi:hypothetical protein
MKSWKLLVALCASAGVLVVVGAALAGSSSGVPAAKKATASFRKLAVAKKAGYTLELKTTPANGSVACIEDPTAGGMGVHMVNPKLLDAAVGVETPEALVYSPERYGSSLELVAVEYVVDRKAWRSAGNTTAPRLFGRQFALITKNPFGLKPFYALHAWIWRKNPSGLLAPYNPEISC